MIGTAMATMAMSQLLTICVRAGYEYWGRMAELAVVDGSSSGKLGVPNGGAK